MRDTVGSVLMRLTSMALLIWCRGWVRCSCPKGLLAVLHWSCSPFQCWVYSSNVVVRLTCRSFWICACLTVALRASVRVALGRWWIRWGVCRLCRGCTAKRRLDSGWPWLWFEDWVVAQTVSFAFLTISASWMGLVTLIKIDSTVSGVSYMIVSLECEYLIQHLHRDCEGRSEAAHARLTRSLLPDRPKELGKC